MSKLTDQIDDAERSRTLARASAPQQALGEAVDAGRVQMSSILAALGFDAMRPEHQAALLACDRYELDPLLKHIVVIKGSGPYITRDGWLHIAHRHEVFDGMTVDDYGVDDDHWWAIVSVYRKDKSHPFTYRGRYPKNGPNAKHGPEMAVKVAEVAALRRAFPVSGVGAYEERWEREIDTPALAAPDPDPDDADWVELQLPGMPDPVDDAGGIADEP